MFIILRAAFAKVLYFFTALRHSHTTLDKVFILTGSMLFRELSILLTRKVVLKLNP